ncbi:uncharacterized protein NEPG_02339 [Nematocida parisii ERTm1]|uniref:C2H2-type domain-containing protein n=1 Tax=Nematocida parisii (strain ERTm3) TaxID=935791 RepID=I3EER3_NEMP3|nr:uncharacterized protein NEPG_02339 [Nematocida parisii ERTm1]EIJ87710.1 hypothetical protein NEQG_02257 [Nematocida parisii ERTm3]EIJ92940.1 hypothetical protein NEPG_02339 [Nematocida parisii ERTm1]KAI5141579.1 hypothetical protein NEPAR04_1069 [Nematocida parisii]|eukprot:XP_013060166.1 hypothetical protein NEPG_02339 [Nematocida parisii ERTm1]
MDVFYTVSEKFLMKEATIEMEDKRKGEGQKPTEGSAVIQMQKEAVEQLKGVSIRHYIESDVVIRTVGGSKLKLKGWSTETKPKVASEPVKPIHTCHICDKTFVDKRRLAIHMNMHEKKSTENTTA